MKFPFWLTDDDWQKIRERETDSINRRRFKDPEEQRKAEVFHLLDLRSEWSCQEIVRSRQLLVILMVLQVALNGSVIGGMLQAWILKK